MRISTERITIESTVDELRQSNTLADGLATMLRRAFNSANEEPREDSEQVE